MGELSIPRNSGTLPVWADSDVLKIGKNISKKDDIALREDIHTEEEEQI